MEYSQLILEGIAMVNETIQESGIFALTDEDKKELVKKYAPDSVLLYYVDYDSNLNGNKKLIREAIRKNSLMPIEEAMWDWWDFPEKPYLDEIEKKMEDDGIGWLYEQLEDDFIDYIRDHDESDPLKDLLNNTSEFSMFYDLCEEYPEGWGISDEDTDKYVNDICNILNIPEDDSERRRLIMAVLLSATGGGDLRIYFNAPIEKVIGGDPYNDASEDFKTIRFKGEYTVAIHNPYDGSGWSEEVKLDCSFEFDRKNLHLSDCGERYNYLAVYGCDAVGDEPIFSMDDENKAKKVGVSQIDAMTEKEAEFERIFSAGGCSFEDSKMERHRDVYYRNEYPAGNKCPHCGRFWID